MKHLKVSLFFLSVLFSFGAASNASLEYTLGIKSSEVDSFILMLNSKESYAVAESIDYPESFSKEELKKDQHAIMSAHKILFQNFGEFSELKPIEEGVSFYEVGLSGGSIYWWAANNQIITKKYLFSVQFSKYGKGYLKLFTSNKDGEEKVVGFYYGLPINNDSKQQMISVMNSLLDSQGVPRNHPYRNKMERNLPVSG
jgi:hypothetical protein